MRQNNADLVEARNAALEEKYVAKTATESLAGIFPASAKAGDDLSTALLSDTGGSMAFGSVAGVLLAADQDRFARTLFRATRGNTYTHFSEIPEKIEDPKSGRVATKSVFVVYFQKSGGA